MADIKRVIDGDTIKTEDGKVRVGHIDTPESVHPKEELNTAEGREASRFAKAVLPVGEEVKTNVYGNDHFGRQLAGVTRIVNGVEIDYGLVALDKQMALYYTKYGKHPDPTKHNEYKEYYSKHVPYQFGAAEEPLTKEEIVFMQENHKVFDETYDKFKSGKATQEEFDEITAKLYGDSNLVMRYRHQLSNWNRPIDQEDGGTLRGAMRIAMEDPELREIYNRSVRNGHLMNTPIPEKEKSFWETAGTSLKLLGSVSQMIDLKELWGARNQGMAIDVPKQELTKGTPEQYHTQILLEAENYNEQSALIMRDQIIEDVENNRQFDNLPLYAQFGYGLGAMVVDPLVILPAAPLAKAGQAVNAAVRGWTKSKALRNTAVLATWAGFSGAEEVLISTPRLAADHTYTARHMQLDVLTSAGLGLGIGTLAEFGVKPAFKKYITDARDSRELEKEQIQAIAEKEVKQKQTGVVDNEAATPELQETQKTANKAKAESVVKEKVAQFTMTPFTPWEAITEVSRDELKVAIQTLRTTFKRNSSIGKLLDRQMGLNDRNLSEAERKIANELNSDVLHLAAAFPDGKVPKGVSKAIEAVTFKQRTFHTINAMERLLKGSTEGKSSKLASKLQDTEVLQRYVDALNKDSGLWSRPVIPQTRNLGPVKPADVVETTTPDISPVSSEEFIKQQANWLSERGTYSKDELVSLTQAIPSDLSFLKDVIELNKLATSKQNQEFTKLVEDLNGIVLARLKHKETGNVGSATASKQSFSATKKLTAPEIAQRLKDEGLDTGVSTKYTRRLRELKKTDITPKQISIQLKREGISPRTARYKQRLQELKKLGRVTVSEQVQKVGDVTEFETGKIIEEPKADSETFHTIDDAKKELLKLQQLAKISEEATQRRKWLQQFIQDVEQNIATKPYVSINGKQALEHPSIPKAKRELLKLDNRTQVEEADVLRAEKLEKIIALEHAERTTTLVKDNLDTEFLPRTFSMKEKQSAYINPTLKTLAELKTRLNSDVLKKLGVKELKGKKERLKQQVRLEKVAIALTKDKQKVLDRMVKAGQWQNIEDVLRASNTIATTARLRVDHGKQKTNSRVRATTKQNVDGSSTKQSTPEKPKYTALTEKDYDILEDGNSGLTADRVTEEEYTAIKQKATDAYAVLVKESGEGVVNGLSDFVRTGEKTAFELGKKPTGILDSAGRLAATLTEDLATKLQNSKLVSLEYVGSRITEIGRGYGGDIRRRFTGGIIRDSEFLESMMQIAPQYFVAVDKYAISKGKNAVSRANAQQMAGAQNKLTDEFNRDVFLIQEYRRQGRTLPAKLDKSVVQFVDQWDKYMAHNHNKLVENNIGGFTAARKVKHYVPHIWKPIELRGLIKKHGESKVEELLTRGYKSASTNGINPISDIKAREAAKRLIDWILTIDEQKIDQFLPVADSRAKQRRDIDTTVEFEGISILDLLDTEVRGLATKYSNRVAGWVGVSKSTDGMLTSQLDIESLKQNMIQEGLDKDIPTAKYEQYYDDLMNMMFGRPVQGGLPREFNDLKDLTVLTRMGSLGTAQLVETGQVITRSTLNTFSSEPVARKVFELANESIDDTGLMREIEAMSHINRDIEHLHRMSVHEDLVELDKINKARQLSLWLADTFTFGKYKAPAGRLLGKTTVYNAVRRYQSRIVQASFVMDVGKHFKDRSGKMGNARMADVGLTDAYGKDTDLQDVFDNIVEYGDTGLVKSLNSDKWPIHVRNNFKYALLRDESQQIQRTQIGELPPWMNKPMMALAFQFREMPIVATNKQLSRSLAFADKEAVTNVMLNTAMAGLVRYAKFAALGAVAVAVTGDDWKAPTAEQMSIQKWILALGFFPDATDFILDAYKAGTMEWGKQATDEIPQEVEQIFGAVPVLGLMNDYYELGFGDSKEQVDAAFGLLPLGNASYGDVIHTWVQETFNGGQ